MPAFYRDDSNVALTDVAGMSPDYVATSIVAGTTSGTVQEISLTAGFQSASGAKALTGGKILVRIANGANDTYYSFGIAGLTPTTATMTLIPQRWIEYVTIDPVYHKSLYILQDTAAGKIQATVISSK